MDNIPTDKMHEDTTKPIIAISLGDPAGVSPEIVAKNLEAAVSICRPVIFGHWPSLEAALERAKTPAIVELATEALTPNAGRASVVHCGPDSGPIDDQGELSALAQFESLEKAADAVLTQVCTCLVTGPVSKSAVSRICPGFKGHTEYLAGRAGISPENVTMVFASRSLTVGLVSTHLPMREVPAAVTRPRLERTLAHVKRMLSVILPGKKPRIGVAALNPHAGEQGILGTEEEEIISPFCSQSNVGDAHVEGPIPAEVLFREALMGNFDGVVAAYHDQAMIPLKLAGVGRMVNATMGLPFIRTSPDHGVAYNIARKDEANPSGMGLAIELAAVFCGSAR